METTGRYDALRLENQLCFPLYACAREVVKLYTPHLSPLGITYTQYIALMLLWESDGVPVGELGRRLCLDSGTLTPLLKKMEAAGLVERRRSSKDERVVTIFLTQKGWELRDKAADVPAKIAGCIRIAPDEAQTLYRILYKILKGQDAGQGQRGT